MTATETQSCVLMDVVRMLKRHRHTMFDVSATGSAQDHLGKADKAIREAIQEIKQAVVEINK